MWWSFILLLVEALLKFDDIAELLIKLIKLIKGQGLLQRIKERDRLHESLKKALNRKMQGIDLAQAIKDQIADLEAKS